MIPEEIRAATRDGILDAFTHIITVGGISFLIVWAVWYIGFQGVLALLAAAAALGVAWAFLRWLLPSTWRRHWSNRRFRADAAAFVSEHPDTRALLDGSERDYFRRKSRLRQEKAHPDHWLKFEVWREKRTGHPMPEDDARELQMVKKWRYQEYRDAYQDAPPLTPQQFADQHPYTY